MPNKVDNSSAAVSSKVFVFRTDESSLSDIAIDSLNSDRGFPFKKGAQPAMRIDNETEKSAVVFLLLPPLRGVLFFMVKRSCIFLLFCPIRSSKNIFGPTGKEGKMYSHILRQKRNSPADSRNIYFPHEDSRAYTKHVPIEIQLLAEKKFSCFKYKLSKEAEKQTDILIDGQWS